MEEAALPIAVATGVGWLLGRNWRSLRETTDAVVRTTTGAARHGGDLLGHGVSAGGHLLTGVVRATTPPVRAGAAVVVGTYGTTVGRFVRQSREGAAPPPATSPVPAATTVVPATEVPHGAPTAEEDGERGAGDLVAVSGGNKFHEPGCRMLGGSPKLVHRDEAESEGRQPCGVCRP